MHSINQTVPTDLSKQTSRSKNRFINQIYSSLFLKEYSVKGNGIMQIMKSILFYIIILFIDICINLLINLKNFKYLRILTLILSFFMILYSSVTYAFSSDEKYTNILIYNLNTISFYLILIIILRFSNYIDLPLFNLFMHIFCYFTFYFLSIKSLIKNIHFYDYTHQLKTKIFILICINQAILTNLLFSFIN